jgi:ABC-type branched-subunit amino acid transport system ATPase component
MFEAVSSDILFAVSGLTKRFGGVPALQDVGFEVRRHEVTALIGPNGAGKTTCLNCATGVIPADAGSMRFGGIELSGLPAHRIARLGIVRTFQSLGLFGRLSALDNVLCGLAGQAGDSFVEAFLRTPALRHRERRLRLAALEALDAFGLAHRASSPAGALSYGERKQLELARAFVSRPGLILLDEPVAGLNPDETERVGTLIRQVRRAGTTLLLVEHDMDLVMSVSDQVVVLDGGRAIAVGPPEDVRRNPLVLEAYLGKISATA